MISAARFLPSSVKSMRQRLGRPLEMVLDAGLAALSLLLAIYFRVGSDIGSDLARTLQVALPLFAAISVTTFYALGMYRKVWRYASIRDLFALIKAVTLAVLIFLLVMFFVIRLEDLPRSTPVMQWFILITLLGGLRLVQRLSAEGDLNPRRPGRNNPQEPALLVGAGDHATLFLQALRRDPSARCAPVGILDPAGRHVGMRLRDVPVLGGPQDLAGVVDRLARQGARPQHLIIAEDIARLGGALVQRLVREGEELGLTVSRLPSPTELRRANQRIELRPIELTDLLTRPQAVLDHAAIDRLIEGRRVLVTGAGGTIGSELTRQIAALQPAQLILLEASEYNLYEIDLTLAETYPGVSRVPVLCNVRDREQLMRLFATHRPELVFHAAALKHVPMVEFNPGEGVLTNVVGTRNVADAAYRHGALAMVQVSSDKVVNPTSVMGATKRLAELYCQALDLQGRDNPAASRFMTVRFGNVLGSSGSLIPLFERQLRRGGPLTVTHPEIKRYFMTVAEAVSLVLQASAHGHEKRAGLGQIFVLDMGEPVKIVDIAQRMIRLAGLQPNADVKIEITGLRPGEKLYEELFDAAERRLPASIPGVLGALPNPVPVDELRALCDALGQAATAGDPAALRGLIKGVLPGYVPWTGAEAQAKRATVAAAGEAPATLLQQAALGNA